MTLRALILGSGFAGQGHARALRDAGVEIVGMASRTESVVKKTSAEMDIPYASTDWRQALTYLQPDIVAVGTPGGAHEAPIEAALAQGCHVLCDKPLAISAEIAKKLYQQAEAAGVKTAYAASYRYMPNVLFAKELVAQGALGEPQEVECVSHFNLNPLIPFGWSHRIDQGGGRLNNNFTHKLSIVLQVLGGHVLSVGGTTRNDMERAPIVAGVHHFRERSKYAPTSAEDPNLSWAAADAEWSYSVIAKIQPERPVRQPASVLFQHSGLQPRFQPDYLSFYGSEGALYIEGHYGQGPMYWRTRQSEWQQMAIPSYILVKQPDIADDTQRNWTILARAFAADIRGEPHEPYQTFKDGWLYQEIIDAIRADSGWTYVSAP